MGIQKIADRVFRGDIPVDKGEITALLKLYRINRVVGHPTFRNARTIDRLIEAGIKAVNEIRPNENVAFVVSDGTYTSASQDSSSIDAALEAAQRAMRTARALNTIVVAAPYEGYAGVDIPGKGSALKMIFDEIADVPVAGAILLDGDLRNDMAQWHRVYKAIEQFHNKNHPGKDFFVTARYARHFVDASLTRFIVGPLTTLMGCYVPGGISGDIFLSRGSIEEEQKGKWSESRRKYGTDIATTFVNIFKENSLIYEVWLGAKLHDITDEAKLSVMPAEVIGSALEQLMHYQHSAHHLERIINHNRALEEPLGWGPEKTGIPFINPGYTDVFDIDIKVHSIISGFDAYREYVNQVLTAEASARVQSGIAALKQSYADTNNKSFRLTGITPEFWIDILHQAIGYLLAAEKLEVVKTALYSAAFLEFCGMILKQLGCSTFDDVRRIQSHLGVDDEQAKSFYSEHVEAPVKQMAKMCYANRKRILDYAGDI